MRFSSASAYLRIGGDPAATAEYAADFKLATDPENPINAENTADNKNLTNDEKIVNAENVADAEFDTDAENATIAENSDDDDRQVGAEVLQEAVNCSCHRPPLIKLQLH